VSNSLFGGIAYAELYVKDLDNSAHYCERVLGFSPKGAVSYEGLISRSFVQGDICLVLTGREPEASATDNSRLVETQLLRHGSHVADIALRTANANEAAGRAQTTTQQLVRSLGHFDKVASPFTKVLAERGNIRSRTLVLPGSLNHTLVELGPGESLLESEAVATTEKEASATQNIATSLDHIAISVPELGPWREFYEHGLGAALVHEEVTCTSQSAMASFAVRQEGGFTVTVTAPHEARPSQITTFMENNGHAPGLQHLAMSVVDILEAVDVLRSNGVRFLDTPGTYYDALTDRVGRTEYSLDALRETGVLVDRDDEGTLAQIFTHPLAGRTLFGELIERNGAQGFGTGNIKALFEAVERAQAQGH
jgi:4-hydroxymandelate synthase